MKIIFKDSSEDIKLIAVDGEIDVYSSMELKKELGRLIDEGAKKIVVNLGKVTYMDSSGLGILVAILKRIRKEQGNMKLCSLTPSIKKIFELTKLTKFFEIYDGENEANEAFN